jgi:hypothetical protein
MKMKMVMERERKREGEREGERERERERVLPLRSHADCIVKDYRENEEFNSRKESPTRLRRNQLVK